MCFYVFSNYDDIKVRYGLNKGYRGISENRLYRTVYIHRQPRPHLPLSIYVSRRNLLTQRVREDIIELDTKHEIKQRRISTLVVLITRTYLMGGLLQVILVVCSEAEELLHGFPLHLLQV